MQETLDLEKEFERCTPYIAAALEYSGGTHTVADVAEMIREGRAQFWPGLRSAIVTEINEYPRIKILNFFLAGGDIDELAIMSKFIENWAKMAGCQRITLVGRRGWERSFLKERGYKPKWFVLAKEIGE
jgi:hypothetical protein